MARRRRPSLPRLSRDERPPLPPPTIVHGAQDTRRAQRRRARAELRGRVRADRLED